MSRCAPGTGAPCYFVLGAVHAVAFYVSVTALTPFVLLVGLFNGRRRLLHDILLGTVVINSGARLAPQPPGTHLTAPVEKAFDEAPPAGDPATTRGQGAPDEL
jgi:hypothetical protein